MGKGFRSKNHTMTVRDNGTIYERRRHFWGSSVRTVSTAEQEAIAAKHAKNAGRYYWACLFGGWLGIHRYITGHIYSGIFYSLTVGGFVVGWIWDLLRLYSGKFRDHYGIPVAKPQLGPVGKWSPLLLIGFLALWTLLTQCA